MNLSTRNFWGINMATLKRERDVLLLKLKANTTPKNIPATSIILPIEQLLEIIEAAYKSGKHYSVFKSKDRLPAPGRMKLKTLQELQNIQITNNVVYISDFHKSDDNAEYKILIKRGNPDIANPSFTHIEKNTTRSVSPEKGETNGQSAHLIISLKPGHKSVEGYRAVFEHVSGLSRSLILPYLNGLIDENTKGDPRFSYQLKNKNTQIYRPAIGHLTNPSASLKKDLKNGYLSSIELIDRKVEGGAGPDDDANIKLVSKKVTYHLKPVNDEAMVEKLIHKVREHGKARGYDYLSVRIRNTNSEKYIASRFQIEEGEAMDKLYSRAETLTGFTSDLKSCYDALHGELCDQMTGTLNKSSNW